MKEDKVKIARCPYLTLVENPMVIQRQSRSSSVHRSRSPSTGSRRLRSNGACERTVNASSTTKAEDAQSPWQSAPDDGGRGFDGKRKHLARSRLRLPPRDRFDGKSKQPLTRSHRRRETEKNAGSTKPRAGGASRRTLAAAEGAGRWRVGF
jgi:hypothetical protein